MELGWIVVMTLRLTKANILRIKETLFQLVDENPLLSVIICVAISAIVLAAILKNKNNA